VVPLEPPVEFLALEGVPQRFFQPLALLEGDRQHRPLGRGRDRVEVENVVPGRRDPGDEEILHVLAVEPVDDRDDRLGSVQPADPTAAEGEAIDHTVGSRDDAGDNRAVLPERFRDPQGPDP
jgi:hypothetical protein